MLQVACLFKIMKTDKKKEIIHLNDFELIAQEFQIVHLNQHPYYKAPSSKRVK